MRLISLLALLLASCGLAVAAPPEVVEVPKPEPGKWSEVKAASGRLLVLSAQPASKWLLVDEDADLREFEAGKLAAFVAAAGKYRLIVTAPDGTPARVVIVVGDQPPGPGPKPPAPKDELKAKLAKAFADDPDPKKTDHAKDLAALYRESAKLAASPELATAGDLLARIRAAATALVADALKPVRAIVAAELGVIFPADGSLSDDQRKKAAALFTRFAEILDTLAGG